MEKKYIQGHLVPITDLYSMLKIIIPPELLPEQSPKQTRIIMAIDTSGSMAGAQIQHAKEALIAMVDALKTYAVPMTVIAFNSYTQIANCTSVDYSPVITFINNLAAGGGTTFLNVFVDLMRIVTEHPTENFYIAFFTDGCDGSPYADLEVYLKKFKTLVDTSKVAVGLHTVGFGSGHDAALLNKIVGFGTKEGSFQYVTSSGDIPKAIDNLSKMVDFANFWGEVMLPNGAKARLNFQQEEDKTYVANISVCMKDVSAGESFEYVVEIHAGKEHFTFPVKITKKLLPANIMERVVPFADLARTTLISMITRMGTVKLSSDELNKDKELIDLLRNDLSSLMLLVMKSKDVQKMSAIEKLKLSKELFTQYYLAYNEAMSKGIISNVSLAKLNNLAYKGVIDNRVAKEMAKRAVGGQKFLSHMVIECEEIKKKHNYEELKVKYKDSIAEFGNCAISYQTWIEALENGDCLCLTYDAERNADDLMDSSTIKIKGINASMLTSQSFVDAAMFLANQQEGLKLAEFGSSTNMAKMLPNEIVNGILPLYICEEHWEIAKLKMKPMNAWADMHDILAISKHQPVRIPFLVLIKALDIATTEFSKKQFKWVLDTCIALYKEEEHKELIFTDYKDIFGKFIDFPQYRTNEFIKNLPIFFTYLCFALLHKDIKSPDIEMFIKCLIEEDLRRNTLEVIPDKDALLKDLCDVFDIDVEKVIKPLVSIVLTRKNLAGQSDPGIAFAQKVKEKGFGLRADLMASFTKEESKTIAELNEKENSIMQSVDDISSTKKVHSFVEKFKAQYEQRFTSSTELVSMVNLYKYFLKPETKINSFSEIGIIAPEAITLFVLQNVTQLTNIVRKASINAGNYLMPFAPSEAILKHLKKMKLNVIEEMKERLVGKELKAAMVQTKTDKQIGEFIKADNPYTAAGLLDGVANKKEYLRFVKELTDASCPCIQDKLEMMLTGTYSGIDLIPDISTFSSQCVPQITKLIVAHFSRLSPEEWTTVKGHSAALVEDMLKKAKKNSKYGHPPLP